MMHVTAVFRATDLEDEQAELPLYTTKPMAGFPVPGDDLVETSLNLHDYVVQNAPATFFVRVAGDSMEGLGIYAGDILTVNRSIEARPGRIVVAVVDGGLVVKQLAQTAVGLALVSAHTDYAPIVLTEGSECYVWGVVTASVRRF